MKAGVKLRILRESKNMSREEMSELLMMSTNTYKRVESGERVLNLDEIQIISKSMSIDPMFFMDNDSIQIKNGDNSPGSGYFNNSNVVTMDKDIVNALVSALKGLTSFLEKN